MQTGMERHTTQEATIEITLALNGTGQHEIQTGIGFLDEILKLFAVHGLFDLTVKIRDDLEVDQHYILENVAIKLGEAFDKELGNRAGIVRVGFATIPVDEALVLVVVDLSGRPAAAYTVEWNKRNPLLLFSHFLGSFATYARANVHARVLHGRDDHQTARALFKALGRALDAATRVDPRRGGAIPSTKGTL
jgi:imidazoleglycerol-phosphate dehydratase